MDRGPISVSANLIVALHPPPHPRESRRLVGHTPDASNRTLLSRTTALVLAEIAAGRAGWDAESCAAPDAAAWEQTAAGLLRARLCVGGDGERGRPPPFDSEIERRYGDVAPASGDPTGLLQLPWNFAMRPGPEGFLAFSVLARRYLFLPPQAVAALLPFVNAQDPDAIADAEAPDFRAWVSWFVARGLLVAARVEPSERVVATRLADVRDTCVKERARLSDDIAELREVAAAAAPRSTGRTPVYFISLTTDLEARSQLPLGLGMIVAAARQYEGGALLRSYHFIPELLLKPAAVRDAVLEHGPGVAFFSDYVWTVESNLRASQALKEVSREFVTVHGGASVPAYEAEAARFLEQHPHIDVAVRGEGEVTAPEILKALSAFPRKPAAGLPLLGEVAGLTFRDPSAGAPALVRTPDRPRATDVNAFPSAYLTGSFDACRQDQVVAAILETNRGCPYGCTFCDWGLGTLQKIRMFDLDRVQAEIAWIAARRIPIIWCADANFGILPRDVEIARRVADARREHGFPRQFLVNYAKNATARLAEILGILRDADVAAEGILAVQTTDEPTLAIIRRSNIKPRKYDELVGVFRGLKLPVATDLLIGLPGATVGSFARDLQYCIDRGVSAKAYRTQVLVNSPMADPAYRTKYAIEVDAQDNIVSTFSFTRDDLQFMTRLYDAYRLYETCGVLFYVLRYLQWDHGIQAADFLRRLVETLSAPQGRAAYPAIAWVDRYSPWNLNVGGWRPFYEDLARYLDEQYGLPRSTALEAALRAQEAVVREPGRAFPETVRLAHDFVAWWQDHQPGAPPRSAPRRLGEYASAEMVVADPDHLCWLDLTRQRQYDYHVTRWELESPLRDAPSVAFFLDAG
jgi:radical SAM superfamily enzyme YgiQ (UPF0313 family)